MYLSGCNHEFYPYGSVHNQALYCRKCGETKPLPFPSELRLSAELVETAEIVPIENNDNYYVFETMCRTTGIPSLEEAIDKLKISKATFYRYRKHYQERYAKS